MLRKFVVFLVLRNCLSLQTEYPKCCDSDSVLEIKDSRYNCTTDLNKRTQINTNRTDFLSGSEGGYCVDVETSASLFTYDGSKVSKVKDLEVDFYPKCCPLDYFYNGTTHGCVKSETKLDTFFGESFVKVGLPQCKIIEDLVVNTNSHLERLNGSLHLGKQKIVYQEGQYCVDRDVNDLFVVRICHDDYDDVCSKTRCIRKCCPDGQSFVNGSKCRNTFLHGLDLSGYASSVDNVNDTFAIVHDGFNPPLYALTTRFKFHIDDAGTFTMNETNQVLGRINVTRSYSVEEKVYCAEHGVKGKMRNYFFFRAFPAAQTPIKFLVSGIAMAISSFFLILTILYYCISDEKKVLFGKILISFCSTSLVAFLLFSIFAFYTRRPENKAICDTYAFVSIYLIQSTFTWMNVMCIDIYCTFGSSRSFSSREYRTRDLKRFLLYSLHGWVTPLLLTVIAAIFYHVDILPAALQLVVNGQKCVVYKGDGSYAVFLFFTIPQTIMQACNLILFIKTTLYCLQVKKEISKMNDTHTLNGEKKKTFKKFRDRFGLLLKLFVIMGISFLFEVVSTFCDFKRNRTMAIIELIWDTFNSLQGVFIFLIFILKKKIYKKFEKKLGLKKIRKISLVSTAMTLTTSVPNSTK